jgi:hypothetical protein
LRQAEGFEVFAKDCCWHDRQSNEGPLVAVSQQRHYHRKAG